MLSNDFIVFGECVGRPRGWRRILADFLCRHTGHLLWRVHNNAGFKEAGDSLVHFTCHCRRCWKWGYVRGDYKPWTMREPSE